MNEFIWWLQGRLISHGFSVGRAGADGDMGGDTKKAIFAFQKAKRLDLTGVADNPTVKALRREPGKPKATVEAPAEHMPPWMAEMHRRLGLHEGRDNAVLSAWLKIGKWLGDPGVLPWCGDAVESCIVKTLPMEAVPANPFWAQGWKNFGIDAGGPVVGAVGVIRWSAKAGHVGFVAGVSGSKVILLGGNQSNAVTLASFPRSKFIAFRWPSTFPFRQYPPLKGKAGVGGLAGTR